MTCSKVETLFSKSEYTEIAEELSLSPRESQIIGQILSGHSDKQIAKNLAMAVPTIRTHLKRTFFKLGVNDKYELIIHVFSQFRMGCYDKGCPRRRVSSKKMTP
jgi:LuxR family maltose regulon positive regulatory protein